MNDPVPGPFHGSVLPVLRRGGFPWKKCVMSSHPGPTRFLLSAATLMLALGSALRAADISEDPLPPADPNLPTPSDWSAWVGVGDLIGVSTAHLESQYDHEGDLESVHRRSEHSTTVFLRLKPKTRFPGDTTLSWRVVEAFGAGTQSSQERSVSRSGGGRSFDYSEQGSYHGPMSLRTDPSLGLHLRDGSWTFGTLTEPAQSWTLQATGRI